MNYLKKTDKDIYNLIQKEEKRLQNTLMMIPSENITSRAVEEAVGSVLGNKYAEGYPGKRYYQGQEVVDSVERLAIERATELFGVAGVNVQAHSGSPANFAVYTALLKPGDTIMGLSLSSGGHLTHGATRNASSIYFNSQPYEVGTDGYLDYDAIAKQAQTIKPKLIIAGTTAYPRLIDWEAFAEIAEDTDAWLMADISHISGLVSAGVYPSPVPHVHVVTTTTHKTLRGPRGALIMTTQKGIDADSDLPKKINSAIIPGIQGGPHLNSIAGIAVALKEATSPSYVTYARQVVDNARHLAKHLVSHGFDLVTGGTDSHLILIDLRNRGIIGNTAAEALEMAGIVLNRNGVPFDPNPPFYPSGIRLGTPGTTSRSMELPEMEIIAGVINDVVAKAAQVKKTMKISDLEERKKVNRKAIYEKLDLKSEQKAIKALCTQFPIQLEY